FNLSLATLLDDTFPDFLQAAMTSSPFEASCFCLEVRESDATQYPDETILLCEAARQIGCRVALDGAGASIESYSLASTLPVDIIKLDQTMMTHLHDDPVQQVMVEALHKIAAAAGKTTVATFIENDDTLRRVRGLGIHYGQGFRLSKPQPLDTLTPAAVELETGRIGGDRAEH
ncbi:MAG: EAL domain-containing protein, partial [Marinobacter sp.]|nr:EAL domain-containing protein [Marinobacter sp.]